MALILAADDPYLQLLSEYAMNFSVMQQRMLELNDLYRKEVKERKALYNSIQVPSRLKCTQVVSHGVSC